ncbi:MAG: hypothetical protein IKW89_05835 [Bacteroidales bacterium]|nr:hypothetical protein [Bacteroidales bacterium]
MKSFPIFGKEKYLSPEMEILPISIETPMLNGLSGPDPSGEPIDGGDDPDLPWPDSGN